MIYIHRHCGHHTQVVLILSNQRSSGNSNGRFSTIYHVTPSDTQTKLWKNSKSWLPTLYKASSVSNSLGQYMVCFQLILLHQLHNKQAFDDACRKKGLSHMTFKMNPHCQIAMCYEAINLNYKHLCTMRPFLNADRCNLLWSEHEIQKLVISPTVVPI